jgi:hypothetical protein
MMALPPSAAAGKLWFEQLPIRTRRIIVAAAAAAVAAFVLYHSQPAYVLEVLDGINTSEEVQQESDYLTTQGKDILVWIIEQRGDKPASDVKAVYSEPVVNGTMCDIPFQTKDGTGTIRLLKTDRWRFDDMYIDKVGDKNVNLWVSRIKDHPIGTWWKLHWFDTLRVAAVVFAFLAK